MCVRVFLSEPFSSRFKGEPERKAVIFGSKPYFDTYAALLKELTDPPDGFACEEQLACDRQATVEAGRGRRRSYTLDMRSHMALSGKVREPKWCFFLGFPSKPTPQEGRNHQLVLISRSTVGQDGLHDAVAGARMIWGWLNSKNGIHWRPLIWTSHMEEPVRLPMVAACCVVLVAHLAVSSCFAHTTEDGRKPISTCQGESGLVRTPGCREVSGDPAARRLQISEPQACRAGRPLRIHGWFACLKLFVTQLNRVPGPSLLRMRVSLLTLRCFVQNSCSRVIWKAPSTITLRFVEKHSAKAQNGYNMSHGQSACGRQDCPQCLQCQCASVPVPDQSSRAGRVRPRLQIFSSSQQDS